MGVPDAEGSGENWWFPCEFGGVVYAECGGRLVVDMMNVHVPGIESVNICTWDVVDAQPMMVQ